jgi:CBS domain-containing protein
MQTREIMSQPAITVTPETPIQSLARLMREKHISGVPVVNQEGTLLGLVTEMDLISRNAPLVEPNYLALLSGLIPVNLQQYRHYRQQLRQVLATTAEQLMNTEVTVVEPTTTLDHLLALMARPEITLLPVVEDGHVLGVVTRTDLVRLIEQLEMAPETPPPA